MRVIAKIAFNVLAKLKGKDFVKGSEFDEVRSFILNGENIMSKYDLYFPKVLDNNIKKYVPKDSHFCLINKEYNYLVAWVSIYAWIMPIVLASDLPKDYRFEYNGFICDWKNKKEYIFLDYVDNNFNR